MSKQTMLQDFAMSWSIKHEHLYD